MSALVVLRCLVDRLRLSAPGQTEGVRQVFHISGPDPMGTGDQLDFPLMHRYCESRAGMIAGYRHTLTCINSMPAYDNTHIRVT